MKTIIFSARVIILVLSITLARQSSIAAGVVTVATESDFRSALAGGGLVTFNVSGTIVLTNTIAITNATTIDGSGQSVIISGGNAVRIFSVSNGVQFSLANLIVANGRSDQGGAMHNAGGSVMVSGCLFTNNAAVGPAGQAGLASPGGSGFGGVVYNAGVLAITDSIFLLNGAAGGPPGSATGPEYNGGDGGAAYGGAIYNTNSLTVTNSQFIANSASGANGGFALGNGRSPGAGGGAFGGAIYNFSGSCVVTNSTFGGNAAVAGYGPLHFGRSAGYRGQGRGGAIYDSSATSTFLNTPFTNNYANGAPASGGAIHHGASNLTLKDSFFLNNTAGADRYTVGITSAGPLGSGGALHNAGSATISTSQFSSNSVSGGSGISGSGSGASNGGDGLGGAIYNLGSVSFSSCTLNGNATTGGNGAGVYSGGGGYGGGLMNASSSSFVNCTIALNRTTPGSGGVSGGSAGGGLYNGGSITNCTISENRANSGSGGNLAGGSSLINSIVAQGSPDNGGFGSLGNNVVSNANPGLGILGNYGGSTLTIPLLAGNPAINGANNAAAPAVDQRGRPRPSGGASDVGSYESSAPYFVMGRFVAVNTQHVATITLDGVPTNVAHGDTFRFDAVTAGAHVMTASNAFVAVTPPTLNLSLGPDVADANFTTFQPINIITPPQSQGVLTGSNITLTVTVSGDAPSYQWQFNGTNLVGATNATLTRTNFQAANAGNYTVVVSNFVNAVTSSPPALLFIVTPPVFTLQPQSRTDFVGNTVVFNAYATGTGPLTYQWRKGTTPLIDGARISGSTSSNLTIANLLLGDAGNYSLVVTNAYGSATSAVATLTVQLSFGSALGSALPWTTSGNLPWFTQTNTTHDGVAAAQSGSITGLQTSAISAVVTGPGTVTFWWKVSSESGVDYLRFLISGTTKVKISGDVDWQQKSFAVPAGTQLLQWTYSKDLDVDDGLDKGWLDEVRFENNLLDYATSITNNGFQFRLDGLSPANYVVLASSNLTTWIPISTNLVSSNNQSIFIDTTSSNSPIRFYRAQQQ